MLEQVTQQMSELKYELLSEFHLVVGGGGFCNRSTVTH